MFDIIKHKDMSPYASGLRWYKLRMTYDGAVTAIFSDDFDQVYGQANPQLPATITGPALVNMYDTPILLNFVAVDVMTIPTMDAIKSIVGSANLSNGIANVGVTDGSLKSDIQLNPSIMDGFPELDIYVKGFALNEAVYDTSEL